VTVNFIVKLLNEQPLSCEGNFFENLYKAFNEGKVYPNDKEKFILNSTPAILFAKNALMAYKVREGLGFLNAVMACMMDVQGYPATCFNEYSLTCRGRNT
jgi:hypothetical protein